MGKKIEKPKIKSKKKMEMAGAACTGKDSRSCRLCPAGSNRFEMGAIDS